jgi:hypothetical protein
MGEIKTGPRASETTQTLSSLTQPQPSQLSGVEPQLDTLDQLKISSSLGITEAALDAITRTTPQPDALTARGLQLSLPPDGIFRINQCEMKVEIFFKESDPVTAA